MWSSLARVARIFSTWFESLHDLDYLDYLDYLRLSVSCCFFHDKQISPGAYAAMLVSLRVRKLDANWNCTVELCTPTGWSKFDRCQPCHKSSRLHRAPCKYKSTKSMRCAMMCDVPSLQAIDQEKTHLVQRATMCRFSQILRRFPVKKAKAMWPFASRSSRTRAGSKLTFRRPLLC